MDFAIVNIKGDETGKFISIPDGLTDFQPNNHTIWLDVKHYLAAQRQGTHKSKEKFEVSYSTKKIKKQKGTGGARAGSIKSGVFVGGGRIFGPRPRSYDFKLNKKVKQLARKSAFVHKLKDNSLLFLDDFSLNKAKTKDFVKVLENLKILDNKTLFLISENESFHNIQLSSRNIPNAKVVPVTEANTYEIMNAQTLVVQASALDTLINLIS
ncbi:MAG TPA: 50S ribosomal protein L4 [Cytophagales bacterium]|nr:50S ribosomal protein L4 [Cytophagales bacterium]